MKTMAKVAAVFLAAVVMVTSMAACAGSSGNASSGTTGSTIASTQGSTAGSTSSPAVQKATINIVDWSDSTKALRQDLNKKFEADNPGITVNYTCLTIDQFASTVLTAINAGNAPDLFPIPSGTTLSTALAQNWYQPINGIVPKDFFDRFSPGTFNEGITSIGDKVYSIPETMPQTSSLFFYNKKILSENNIDPSTLTTWTAFENACKTVTAAGKGKYYGIVEGFIQTARLEYMVRAFASLDGAKCNDNSTIAFTDDGKSWYNSKPMLEAMGFLQKLANDKVFHPNSSSISAPEARALFGQGQAAFIMQGSWCIPVWRKSNPDLDFGVMATPSPDSGIKGSIPVGVPGAWYGISSKTKIPDVAGKYLDALYSEDYQGKCVAAGGYVSTLKGVNEKYNKDQTMLDYIAVAAKMSKLAPNAIIGNPDSASVYAEAKSISPNIGQITQGVVTGSIKDYTSALNTLANASVTEWTRAINAAAAKGKKVSVKDFEFPNWDSSKDYTDADYKSR